ncbi:hypothetical protein [Geminisphaera colitermitum]|uniref:hypothetical protein n=1 Tax=Geminisphaera colitermitum TaxID=1148786 RepID=UPI0001965561|nr:hypothetical protein [Geminisphaera colitermitum]
MADEPDKTETPPPAPAPEPAKPEAPPPAPAPEPEKKPEAAPQWAVDLAAVVTKVAEAVAALKAAPAPAPAAPPPDPDYQRTHQPGAEGSKGPDYLKGGAETDQKRDAAVAEYQAAHPDASFEQAWDAVRAAKPELFT